jgi:hypothetical protein
MFARLAPTAAVVILIGWAVSAQPPGGGKDDSPPARAAKADAKPDGPVFEIRLADDTLLKVVLLDGALPVATKYGKLTVPAADIRRLDFGFRYPDGMEEKIEKAIGELGAPEFRDREAAEQALAACGHYAIPALRRAVKSENPEVVRRAGSVLKAVESKLGPEKAELRDYDIVETTEFTAKGRIELGVLKVRTKYFGEATVRLTDIRAFRSVGTANNAEFNLDAALYAKVNQSQWLETAIEVTAGQQLEVTASGQIDLWPQGPGQYMTGPGGQGGGGLAPPGAGVPRVGVAGQIIARIGPSGNPFVVGASFKGKVSESGKLYLRIHPSPWNNDSAGSYKVKVTVSEP